MEMLRSVLHELFAIEAADLPATARMRDLGLDSLQVLDIMMSMEDRLSMNLADLSLPPNPDLCDVATAIHNGFPSAARK